MRKTLALLLLVACSEPEPVQTGEQRVERKIAALHGRHLLVTEIHGTIDAYCRENPCSDRTRQDFALTTSYLQEIQAQMRTLPQEREIQETVTQENSGRYNQQAEAVQTLLENTLRIDYSSWIALGKP